MSKLSPMMQQYMKIKDQHKDHILFFRLGDFYEMFFEDAKLVSKELELTLTGKECGLPERAPMCGVPYHSANSYIRRLIDKGYKVAICEQMEDPATAKGLVKRDVIRLITPGTVIEEDLLEESKNNYLAALMLGKGELAVCFADVSTGEIMASSRSCSDPAAEAISELAKFTPSELLYSQNLEQNPALSSYVRDRLGCVASSLEKEGCLLEQPESLICSQFGVESSEELGIREGSLLEQTLAGLVQYVKGTQKDGAKRLSRVTLYGQDEYMNIDLTARRNLEITQTMRAGEKRGSLLWVLDQTKTGMGKRFLRKALEQPLMGVAAITRRQNAIGELLANQIALEELRGLLDRVYDLERLLTRVLYGTASPRELNSLAQTAALLPDIKEQTSSFSGEELSGIYRQIDPLQDVVKLVESAIVEDPPLTMKGGDYIRAGFHQELDELKALRDNAADVIQTMEQAERERTGIKTLKIRSNKVFGYYIEVTNSFLDQVPQEYIRKQTLTGCERFITQELKELESRVLTASEKIVALEAAILTEVRQYIASRGDAIQATSAALARLDFLCSLAQVARENDYVCPRFNDKGTIRIQNGRHPVVEKMLTDSVFVPNDVWLDQKDNRMLIITGPNMAGKSTYMRQVAVIAIMAQIGSYVPATQADLTVVDRIFTRVGASDDLTAGQSTFMVEMTELAHILKYATPKSLVILDEIGRGTSTYDGMSLARAAVEYMVNTKRLHCKTLFATHYHELCELEQSLEGVKNYNIAVKKRGDDITFLRKIVPGGADDSFGIEVAKLAGLPQPLLNRAKEILAQLNENPPAGSQVSRQPKQPSSPQMQLTAYVSQVEEELKKLNVDLLTPIEALNELYELKKLLP